MNALPGTLTGRGVLVAVIDSGWDRTRSDPRVGQGASFVHPDEEFGIAFSDDDHDRHGHGTTCARLILDAAPEVRILPIRVFGSRLETSVPRLRAALALAAAKGARVVNMSLATVRKDSVMSLYAACEDACGQGATIVAAADRSSRLGYPAVFANVIGVQSEASLGQLEYRYHPEGVIECSARGTPLEGDGPVDIGRKGSNSFAAARISGIIALCRELYPSATLDQVRTWLAVHGAGARAVIA